MTDHTQAAQGDQKIENADGGVVDHRTVGKEVGLALKVKTLFLQDSLERHLEETDSSLDLEGGGSWAWKMMGKVG